MKDSEFIELLNLYLDHEITPADAVRLESEVQRDSKRRRLYEDYCRMQKACVLVAQNPSVVSEPTAHNVLAFEPTRSWGFTAYAGGLLAAAACVALVLVARNRFDASSIDRAGGMSPLATNAAVSNNQVQMAARTSVASPAIASAASAPSRASNELKSVFTARSIALNENENRTDDILPAMDARFEWMNRVQMTSLKPVAAEELLFKTKSNQPAETLTFRSAHPIDEQFDRTAFQFQR